jgi:hypothetical protein
LLAEGEDHFAPVNDAIPSEDHMQSLVFAAIGVFKLRCIFVD